MRRDWKLSRQGSKYVFCVVVACVYVEVFAFVCVLCTCRVPPVRQQQKASLADTMWMCETWRIVLYLSHFSHPLHLSL